MLILLSANVLHGLLAMVWAAGVRRLVAPGSAAFAVSMLAMCLAMPVAVAVVSLLLERLAPGLAGDAALLRVTPVAQTVVAAAPPVAPLTWTLLGGTVVLFVAQELVRAVTGLQTWRRVPRAADPTLDALVARLADAYRAAGLYRPKQRTPAAARLETDRPVALLAGLWRPTVLVSRGLVARLDPEQLEAVVAHELAHVALGGNLRLLFLWLLRALQAPSPAALVLFRALTAKLEAACDTLAARITGKPAVLASALLQVHRTRTPSRPVEGDAVSTTVARGDQALLRMRVRGLLDAPPAAAVGSGAVVVSAALLGGLLWSVR